MVKYNKKINWSKNSDILITNADKGNVTVALDKTSYIHKMEEIFSDKDTYQRKGYARFRRVSYQ